MTWTCKHDVAYGYCMECQSDKKPNPVPPFACCEHCDGSDHNCATIGGHYCECERGCDTRRAPVVEPEQPTSVGNAASDPHLASYCTNPDCVKIINHDPPCVVEPCEGCPDPELPCKGCPAVEPEQTLKGPQPNPRYATGGPEYVAWCEGHEAGWSDAQPCKTTNTAADMHAAEVMALAEDGKAAYWRKRAEDLRGAIHEAYPAMDMDRVPEWARDIIWTVRND